MEGQKTRGSDKGPNFILVNGTFYNVTPDLVSFEMQDVSKQDSCLLFIGWSKHLNTVFAKLKNGMRVIHKNVDSEIWQSRINYRSLQLYYSDLCTFALPEDTSEDLHAVANQYVLDHYLKLEYQCTIVQGLWATEYPEKVIDPEGVLFQIQ